MKFYLKNKKQGFKDPNTEEEVVNRKTFFKRISPLLLCIGGLADGNYEIGNRNYNPLTYLSNKVIDKAAKLLGKKMWEFDIKTAFFLMFLSSFYVELSKVLPAGYDDIYEYARTHYNKLKNIDLTRDQIKVKVNTLLNSYRAYTPITLGIEFQSLGFSKIKIKREFIEKSNIPDAIKKKLQYRNGETSFTNLFTTLYNKNVESSQLYYDLTYIEKQVIRQFKGGLATILESVDNTHTQTKHDAVILFCPLEEEANVAKALGSNKAKALYNENFRCYSPISQSTVEVVGCFTHIIKELSLAEIPLEDVKTLEPQQLYLQLGVWLSSMKRNKEIEKIRGIADG